MKLALKVLALTVLYMVLFIVFSGIFITNPAPPPAGQEYLELAGLALIALVDSLVVVQLVRMAAWSGWRLALALMVGFYGVTTFMSQIESWWFADALGLPMSLIGGLFLFMLPVTVIFILVAVWLLGRWNVTEDTASFALHLPWSEWLWKLALIAVVYVALYFSFGYFVAWQNPDLRQMYSRPEGAWAFRNELLIPWQVVRGLLWGLIAMVVVRSLRGSQCAIAMMIAVLFAFPMNIVHILPNPYMPIPGVRLSHFIETVTSNFIFGIVVVYILSWRPKNKSE